MDWLVGRHEETGAVTVLGRTGSSWLKISIFYVIYYALLLALAYGTLAWRQGSLSTVLIGSKTVGVGKPFIDTRLGQVGVRAWPHHQDQSEDDNNYKFSLGKWNSNKDAKAADRPDNKYADYVEYFLLGRTTLPEDKQEHLHIGSPVHKGYCNEKSNTLVKLFGDNWNTYDSLKFVKPASGSQGCSIDWKILRNLVTTKVGGERIITKPFVYLLINKKINFDLQEVFVWEKVVGVKPKYNRDQYGSPEVRAKKINGTGPEIMEPNMDRAFFNCFVMDTNNVCKVDGAVGKTYECETSTAKATPIVPYIRNKDYQFEAYTEDATAENTTPYIPPFAMFQMDASAEDARKGNLQFRCNLIARNVQYPYKEDLKLQGNQLIMQNGMGHADFGFVWNKKAD